MNQPVLASWSTMPSPPAPLRENLREDWMLDPAIAFLNHGSFGATPTVVLEEQQRWRDLMEREPVHFYERLARPPHDAALERVAALLGCDDTDLAFTTNATEGVHAVVRSMHFGPGDGIITTAHAYDAVAHFLRDLSMRTGAEVEFVPIDLPFDPAVFVASMVDRITPRTRLVIIDHITSISAIVLPIGEVIAACSDRGVDVLIDGAHGPGMIDINLRELNPAYYAGNLHKWVCAPKGAAALYVRRDRRSMIHPNTISNHYGKGFRMEFAWQGTRDITPWLSVPAAILFFERLGWDAARRYNRTLLEWAVDRLCTAWGVEPITPPAPEIAMASIPLPPDAAKVEDRFEAMRLLYERFGVEALVVDVNGTRMVRISAQVYNRPQEYERLAEAVESMWMDAR